MLAGPGARTRFGGEQHVSGLLQTDFEPGIAVQFRFSLCKQHRQWLQHHVADLRHPFLCCVGWQSHLRQSRFHLLNEYQAAVCLRHKMGHGVHHHLGFGRSQGVDQPGVDVA